MGLIFKIHSPPWVSATLPAPLTHTWVGQYNLAHRHRTCSPTGNQTGNWKPDFFSLSLWADTCWYNFSRRCYHVRLCAFFEKRYNFMFFHLFNIIGYEWDWKWTRSVLSIALLNAYSLCGLKLCRGRSLTGQRIKTLSRIITVLLLCYAANKISVDAAVTACYIMLCHVTPTLGAALFLKKKFYSKSAYPTQSTILPQNKKNWSKKQKKDFFQNFKRESEY